MSPTREIVKILQGLIGSRDLYTAFRDSMEMLALAVANGCDRSQQFDAREARYLEIAKAYSGDELNSISHILSHLAMAMETEFSDYLGQVFMQLELGSDAGGQFFTPYDVCRFMAQLTINDGVVSDAVAQRGYVTVQEPAVGAGGMVLAMEEVLRQRGRPGVMHVTCVDVDVKAVHMAFLQLSLAGIPAVVIHGNTLSMAEWGRWYTPAHVLQGWGRRLRRGSKDMNVTPPVAETGASMMPSVHPTNVGQLDLFGVEP